MINVKYTFLVVFSMLLIACTATEEKEANSLPEVTRPDTKAPEPKTNDNKFTQSEAGKNQIAPPSDIARLQSQVTALQEQLIKVNNDTAAILKMNQIMIAQSQATASVAEKSKPTNNVNPVSSSTNEKKSLDNILKKLEDISPSPQGSFGIVSSYTAKKQWVLLRFDRQTGETWLADSNGWNPLLENEELSVSQYDVHLIRADQDQKGFVASRIDRRTGDTWWLNKNQWVVYQ